MRIILGIFIFFLMISSVHAEQPRYPLDPGGDIYKYARSINDSNWRMDLIQIRGECYSACTMYLGAMKVCVWPEANLYFHEARSSGWGETYWRGGVRSEEGTRFLESYYPLKIYNWVKKNKATAGPQFTKLTGEQAIKLGMPNCRKVLK